MAGQASILDDAEVRAKSSGFVWTDANAALSLIDVVFGEVDR